VRRGAVKRSGVLKSEQTTKERGEKEEWIKEMSERAKQNAPGSSVSLNKEKIRGKW